MSSQEVLFEEMYEQEMLDQLQQTGWIQVSQDEDTCAAATQQRDEQMQECILDLFKIIFLNTSDNCAEIYVPNELSPENMTFCPGRGVHLRDQMHKKRRLTKTKRAQYILVLSHMYQLFKNKQNSTKRNIYYTYNEYIKRQTTCNNVLRELSGLLGRPLPEMRVISTSKTLIAGPLQFRFQDFELDCSKHANGVLVPNDLTSLIALRSTAKFMLIVEKDAIFQQLAVEHKLLSRAILMTGKGYPDVNARCLVRMIADLLHIPIYVLVDCDVYGMEIFFVYRFGSLTLAVHCDQLAVTNIRLIGLLPSEVNRLKLAGGIKFTNRDAKKLQSLLLRPYVDHDPKLKQELTLLQQSGIKTGLQSLNQIEHGSEFLSDYIEKQIQTEKWL